MVVVVKLVVKLVVLVLARGARVIVDDYLSETFVFVGQSQVYFLVVGCMYFLHVLVLAC